MKVWWRELRSVLTVGAVSAGVVLAFPLSALDFRARTVSAEAEGSAAFVRLAPEVEELVLRAAKTTWQEDSSAMQRMRVRLPLGDLPEEDMSRPLDLATPQTLEMPRLEPIPYRMPAYRPSAAAGAPVRIVPEPETKPTPAFSRDELLDLN